MLKTNYGRWEGRKVDRHWEKGCAETSTGRSATCLEKTGVNILGRVTAIV